MAHLKIIAAPKTWHIKRKAEKFVTRPNPGAHSIQTSMSISSVLRLLLKVAKTSKEVKAIMHDKDVLVDGKRRKETRHSVGFMDVVSIPELKESYRIIPDSHGRLSAIKISENEAKTKLSRIESKTMIKGNKTQLNMSDGRAIILDKNDYATGDVLEIEIPSQKIKTHLKFDKNMLVLLVGGKHAGDHGKVEEIKDNKIIYSSKSGSKYETLRKYAFLIGKDKSLITLE